MFDTFVAFQARLQPRAQAVIAPARQASFAELDADVNRFAGGLLGLDPGVPAGVVSIQLGDPYLQLVAMLALARLGVASSPANDDRADLRLTDQPGGEGPRPLRLTPDWLAATLQADAAPPAQRTVEAGSLGRVMLSSGTTRMPRRVGLSWRMIDANIRSAAVTYGAARGGRWVPFTGVDSILGFTVALTAWAVGAAVVVGVSELELPARLEALRPTLLAFTPVHLRTLLQGRPPDFAPQAQLRVVIAGSALPAVVAREARLRLTHDVQILYGATECSSAVLADAALLDTTPGAAGYPIPGVRVEVVDPEGAALPPGVQGEVRIASDRTASGYIDDPVESAKAFRHGGFYPGDLGRMLPGGRLVVDGRLDDRMNLGGHKFLPNLMEEAALACPGVRDAAAFAAPDAQGIDHCWLAVVRGEGFDRQGLVEHLERHRPALPPAAFAWIEEIPRNAMGKIERRRLSMAAMAVLGVGADA